MKKQNCLQIDDVVCIRTDNIRQWELDGLYTTVGTVWVDLCTCETDWYVIVRVDDWRVASRLLLDCWSSNVRDRLLRRVRLRYVVCHWMPTTRK